MDRTEIYKGAQKMKTVKDFASLLNHIKRDEFGTQKYKITEQQLLHFANAKIVPNRYKTFQIRKKSGGTRDISAPCYQLGVILYITNILLKSLYEPSASVTGFTEGKSVVDNAQMHVNHHYVFNIDLKDFFPSVRQARVWARLQLPPFNFSQEIANVVAGLCCHFNAEGTDCVLPQGAATSPLLTNAVCDTMDRRMRGVAKRFGLHYSRYADDITFSSMHNVYQENSDFRKELRNIIEGQNFCINDKKTRLLRTGQRQEVTGLTVNSKVNVTRKYVRDIRYILHLWESKGYAFAYSKFYKFYKTEKGYIKKGEPVMENVIGGKLNYLRMIKGAGNECYQKLLQCYNKLQQIIYVDNNTDKGHNYVYVQQYTLTDFENDFKTKITLQISDDEKLVGKCNLFGMDKTISISHKTQEELCPIISHLKVGDTFTSEQLKDCFVTLCRQKGKNFWLITHKELDRSRCLSIQNAQIDPEKLLKEWEQKGFEFVVKQFQTDILKKSDAPDYV
jgi:retron-type reverse transcriptase